MKAKTFEDMKVWQDSRDFVKSIYELTASNNFAKDYGLKDQIQRAAVSIMNNIAEGFERDGNKEFVQFLSIAKGSSGETRSQLYRAMDQHYIDDSEYKFLYNNLINVSIKIKNMMSYLKKSGLSGDKFKK